MNMRTSEQVRLVINLIFAVYNCILGLVSHSWWFVTISAYYVILAVMRVAVISFSTKNKTNEKFVMRFSGVMLFVLAVVLCGIVYMTVEQNNAVKYHDIAMITIALYAFTKLTLAITAFVKSAKNRTPYIWTLRSIAFTDAVVSIYSLQKSMLVSFEGMSASDIVLFNMLSGIGMCIIVISIGLNLILKGKNNTI